MTDLDETGNIVFNDLVNDEDFSNTVCSYMGGWCVTHTMEYHDRSELLVEEDCIE